MSKGENLRVISSDETIGNIFFVPVFILDGLKYDTNETSWETETIWGLENRLAVAKGEGRQRDGSEAWDQQQQRAGVYGVQKQHGPTAEHGELYAISCAKP